MLLGAKSAPKTKQVESKEQRDDKNSTNFGAGPARTQHTFTTMNNSLDLQSQSNSAALFTAKAATTVHQHPTANSAQMATQADDDATSLMIVHEGCSVDPQRELQEKLSRLENET